MSKNKFFHKTRIGSSDVYFRYYKQFKLFLTSYKMKKKVMLYNNYNAVRNNYYKNN